jgi:hypothetical protein
MADVLQLTYETVDKESLRAYLHLDGDGLDEFIAKRNWKKSLDVVELASPSLQTEEPDFSQDATVAKIAKWPFTAKYLK